MTVVSLLRLAVRAEARDRLPRLFEELGIFALARESGGFLGGRLLRPLAADGPFVVLAEWEDAAAYRGWLENPARAGLAERLEPLLAGEVIAGELFEDVEEAR
jgi:heme-degrading monooxygenase HmoA